MKVRWDGPSGVINRDVGAETGEGDVLEEGAVYDVSDELGKRLVGHGSGENEVAASHGDWAEVKAAKPPPKDKS